MTDPSVKRLQDHIALWRAVLTVFTAPDERASGALRAATACEIASRTSASPDRQLAERFGLNPGELEIVTLLASAAMDRSIRRTISELEEGGDLTTDRLRELVFGVEPSLAGQQALRPHGALRRLALIERSDAGGPLVHDSRRTWTVSQRVLNWLHGDTSVDAELARIVRIPEDVPAIDRLAIASTRPSRLVTP